MKQTRHSLMAKGIMVLLSLLVLIFTFTYSWFVIDDPDATASGISAKVSSGGDFEYAVGFYNNGTAGAYKVTDFTKDSTQLNLERLRATDGKEYNLLHDYQPIDLTGDGATLIRPAMSYGNSRINTTSLDYSIAEPNSQYINFDLYFRSKSSGVSIKLGNGSWAKGACEINAGETMTGANAANKSTYGDFSRDAIVGAVRIGFVPYDYSDTIGNIPSSLAQFQSNTPNYLHDSASLLWLPRPDLHLNEVANSLKNWTLNTNSTSTDDSKHKFYNIFKNYPEGDSMYHKEEVYPNTITPTTLSGASQTFTSISGNIHIGEYYYTKVNVRIWVEGTDTEARRATSGGRFAVNFKFTTT